MAPYCRSYLQYIIQHRKYYCRIYVHILSLALAHSRMEKENTCLVDYGAGNGVLGIFAKFAGFHQVFINDITPDFLHAAKELAAALKIPVDGFIEGNINEVQSCFSVDKPGLIVGSDVIEHIYDLENFFTSIQQINPAMTTVFTTASNPFNPVKVWQLKKIQLKDELHGGSPDEDTLYGELPEPSFISTRKIIIRDYAAGSLDETAIDAMAASTRGLIKKDIESAVDSYTKNKFLPVILNHPTNTCDPTTGSWSERLMSLQEYESVYAAAGFRVCCYNGFYNQYESSLKSRLMLLLNKLIPFTGHRLAPFICLVGKPVRK